MKKISDINDDAETKYCFNCGEKISTKAGVRRDYCYTCYTEIILKK